MADSNKFKPGTVIRFQGLTQNPKMNNSYGIVRKQLEDGNLRIQTNSLNDMAVKPKFCKPIIQCMNRNQRNVPILIHPRIKGEYFPRVHWLHEAPKDIFPAKAFSPKLMHKFNIVSSMIKINCPDKLIGEENMNKTIKYLTETLNWKDPVILPFHENQKTFIIWYDKESTAKINDAINTIVNSDKQNKHGLQPYDHNVEIRGPVVYFEFCKMLCEYYGETPINNMMAIMISHVEIAKDPSLVSREPSSKRVEYSEEHDVNNFGKMDSLTKDIVEQDSKYIQKRMAVLKNMMSKRGRVCEKVGGKQKCPDCKSFSKEPKQISPEMEAAMDMMYNDPKAWYENLSLENKCDNLGGVKASEKVYHE